MKEETDTKTDRMEGDQRQRRKEGKKTTTTKMISSKDKADLEEGNDSRQRIADHTTELKQ